MKKKSAKKTVKRKASKSYVQTFHLFIFSSVTAIILLALGTFFFASQTTHVTTCANQESCVKDLSGKFDPSAQTGEFMGKTVPVRNVISVNPDQKQFVLGDSTAKKRIYIDLTTQHIYANEGDKTVMDFPVSTGKWGRTPTGTFNIWIKLKYTRMSGGNPSLGTYYNLPNVPYTMYFYNKDVPKSMGYGIHGAYWHNNFGHPMSHGCINMKTEDVEKLYAWANPVSTQHTTYASKDDPGTEIVIYGTAPQE